MDAIITLSEVKSILQISDTDTSKDDLIQDILIPSVEDYIITYCNDDFIDGFPEGLKLATAKMINLELAKLTPGITSETIGKYSVSYSSEYPKDILTLLNRYRKVKFF